MTYLKIKPNGPLHLFLQVQRLYFKYLLTIKIGKVFLYPTRHIVLSIMNHHILQNYIQLMDQLRAKLTFIWKLKEQTLYALIQIVHLSMLDLESQMQQFTKKVHGLMIHLLNARFLNIPSLMY
jgi:hypothetical protein